MNINDLVKTLKAMGYSDADIASEAAVSTKTVENWSKGTFQPRQNKLRKLENMLAARNENPGSSEYQKVRALKKNGDIPPNWPGIPMYDIPVTLGAIEVIRDEPNEMATFFLPIPQFRDCTFGTRASGDSMYPEIRNGDYVICKEIENIIFGDIYLVITYDGHETVKYVHPHPEKEDFILLVSRNDSVPRTPLPKTAIRKIYKVKGVIKAY